MDQSLLFRAYIFIAHPVYHVHSQGGLQKLIKSFQEKRDAGSESVANALKW